jgi:hypothetical protein
MNSFKQFNIKPEVKGLEGEKIKIEKILNREITVEAFRIEKSKYPKRGDEECLYMQVDFNKEKRVVFSGSGNLMSMIRKVPESGFPFTTTIVKENDRLEFT